MVDNASCHLSCYTSTHASIWHRYTDMTIMGSRPWPFGVTWRHQSRDHSTPGGRLPMGGP